MLILELLLLILCDLSIVAKGLAIFFLFFLFLIGMHLVTNIIKSKNSICDVEKQSKFILECLNTNKTKEWQSIGACERIAITLYCK
jgi:hypothetical protein